MGIDNLSEEEKKLLLEELLKDVGKTIKRKRKRKRKSPKQDIAPTERQTQQPPPNVDGRQWVPVQRGKRENKFDNIVNKLRIPNDDLWKESDKYDYENRQIDRDSTRENNTGNLIKVRCKVCQKEENVSISLVQRDPDLGNIYYCNRCSMGGSR